MRIDEERYSRQVALFGWPGQRVLETMRVAIVGLGGVGSHVAQQLALLGVRDFDLIDDDQVSQSNLNRLIGAVETDVDALKVEVAARMVQLLRPNADVHKHPVPFGMTAASLLETVDAVMSCVDEDSVRLEITARCVASGVVFFDLATDTGESQDGAWFGGRVLFSGSGDRCLSCMDLLDQAALRRAGMTPGQHDEEERIYGIDRRAMDASGPSVVSVNGVVASLAVTELMKWATGLAPAAPLLTYRGDRGTVHRSVDQPAADCFYCGGWPDR